MKLIHSKNNDVMVVTIREKVLDASLIDSFREEILPALKTEAQVVFDMSDVQLVDSSGIGAILSCLRVLSAEGGDLKICSLSKPVRALFELVRMHKIFEIFADRETAVESFR